MPELSLHTPQPRLKVRYHSFCSYVAIKYRLGPLRARYYDLVHQPATLLQRRRDLVWVSEGMIAVKRRKENPACFPRDVEAPKCNTPKATSI